MKGKSVCAPDTFCSLQAYVHHLIKNTLPFPCYEITKFNEIGKSIHTHYVLFTVRKYCFPNDKK